jgi:dipeptidyl-peptidase-4
MRFLALTLAILSVPAILASNKPNGSVDIDELSKYVYPANRPATVSMSFMPDGLSYLVLSDDGKSIVRHDTKSGSAIETILDVTHTRESSISHIAGFEMSPDGTKLLVYTHATPIYRRSFTADYYVFEIKRNILKPLSDVHSIQQSPVFSPDGRMVAFVFDNNIYVKKLDYGTEVAVTTDGVVNQIINGVPDWTYQEEFATECSMAWSPDNTTLSYLKYDETQVPIYALQIYEGTCDPKPQYAAYPGAESFKYPVAGKPNSKVTLHSYDVETRKVKTVAMSDSGIEYIPRIAYGPESSQLVVTTLNRDQNRMELYVVNPKSTVSRSIYVAESKTWIASDEYENTVYGADGITLFSNRSGYNHLYRYSYNGQLLRQLTSGNYNVTDYYGTSSAGTVYFQSTISGAINRVVCALDSKGRLTRLSSDNGSASMAVSPTLNYYILNTNSVNTPPVYTLYSDGGKKIRILEDNADYASRYSNIPHKEFFTFENDGNTLNGYMIKPLDFNASKRYPVIMYQYSGPGSQEVLNRWKVDWDCYFAQKGYIVICVDGRGTGGRERSFTDIVYKRLGYYETLDQIAAARYAASLPYVDANRIGICGWSYGGYETLMAVSNSQSPYAAAVAIAPVTDWRYYDTVYTERYMQTPQQNAEGYDKSSPVLLAGNLTCRLLVMCGTADDNVHPCNTMQYVSALQSQGLLCDMLLFPNMNHSINGCNARAMVYGKMLDYFNRNL